MSDPILKALDDLEVAIDGNVERAAQIKARIQEIRERRAAGLTYKEIVSNETSPLIVQLISESAGALADYGVQLRRTQARVLYEEGLTMERIAVLFGVTRQRVSALLKASSG